MIVMLSWQRSIGHIMYGVRAVYVIGNLPMGT